MFKKREKESNEKARYQRNLSLFCHEVDMVHYKILLKGISVTYYVLI